MAKSGDTTALRLVLERLMPPLRARAEPITFKLTGETHTEQSHTVLAAMSAGQLTPDQAAKMLDALAVATKIREVDELAARCAELEAELAVLRSQEADVGS